VVARKLGGIRLGLAAAIRAPHARVSSVRLWNPAAHRKGEDAEGWLSEDEAKRHVAAWLEGLGWNVAIAWGYTRKIDIRAEKGNGRWHIEVKGGDSLPAMRVNYFPAILGEILQQMDDPSARYSIALPSLREFKRLCERNIRAAAVLPGQEPRALAAVKLTDLRPRSIRT
jgi:hypothetical protein